MSSLKSCHQSTANKGFGLQLKNFIAKENIQLPVILGQDVKGSDLKILIDKRELATCSKDHRKFLSTLDKLILMTGNLQ